MKRSYLCWQLNFLGVNRLSNNRNISYSGEMVKFVLSKQNCTEHNEIGQESFIQGVQYGREIRTQDKLNSTEITEGDIFELEGGWMEVFKSWGRGSPSHLCLLIGTTSPKR